MAISLQYDLNYLNAFAPAKSQSVQISEFG